MPKELTQSPFVPARRIIKPEEPVLRCSEGGYGNQGLGEAPPGETFAGRSLTLAGGIDGVGGVHIAP